MKSKRMERQMNKEQSADEFLRGSDSRKKYDE